MRFRDIGPVERLSVAMVQREPPIFHLQGQVGNRRIVVALSFEMLEALSEGIPDFLAEVHRRFPELPPEVHTLEVAGEDPSDHEGEAVFRASTVGLGYEREQDLVFLEFKEEPAGGNPSVVRLWCTREQLLDLALSSMDLMRQALPVCPQCGRVVPDLENHICPRKNGHGEDRRQV